VEGYKFGDVIDAAKFANCKTCSKYIYTLPCNIEVDFEDYLLGVGNLKYPLKKCKVIKMDNEYINMISRVGRTWLEVKFKKDEEKVKPVLEVALAGYVELKQQIRITFG
jgi:hypothetical protein